MQEFSKSQKRRLRELTARLYELELKKSLTSIQHKFDEWEAGRLSSLELSQTLHDYDYGESRRLWARYQSNRQDALVARGYALGLLPQTDLGPDLLERLRSLIEFYQDEPE